MKKIIPVFLLLFVFFYTTASAQLYSKSETFDDGKMLLTLSHKRERLKKNRSHFYARIDFTDPTKKSLTDIKIQIKNDHHKTYLSVAKIFAGNQISKEDSLLIEKTVIEFINEINGKTVDKQIANPKYYPTTNGHLSVSYDPHSLIIHLEAVFSSQTSMSSMNFFLVQPDSVVLATSVEKFLNDKHLYAATVSSDSISKAAKKISGEFIRGYEKENAVSMESIPMGNSGDAQNSDGQGWQNGIAFTHPQLTYEYSNGQIWLDTTFKTPAGFVINNDVLPFNMPGNDSMYVQFTYIPYSHGVQLQPRINTERAAHNTLVVTSSTIIYPIKGVNGRTLCIPKAVFDTITKTPRYVSGRHWKAFQFVSGQLTIPFKLRPKRIWGADTLAPFRMTTDVTIGVYGGIRWRPAWGYNDFFITFPITGGLTFINVTNNTTTITAPESQISGVTPGFTWSTGLIIQYKRTNIGFVIGRDYASDYDKKWMYHDQTWYSFAIGYSFLKPD